MELSSFSVISLVSFLMWPHVAGSSLIPFSSISFHSLFLHITLPTFVPIITNAIGGILVGLVTKHSGTVSKGFALIFGILLSGAGQAYWGGGDIEAKQLIGGALAIVAMWLYNRRPILAVKEVYQNDTATERIINQHETKKEK